jgi:molybdopterin guanine dinucleotide-containing S/N-oxide reductase-like protein
MPTVVHAACPHDCPDACGVLITIDDGRATKIQGDPAHPVTRGFLCAKVAKYIDRVYSPDRVLYPLRRIGPKGTSAEGAFQRISWDAALDTIVSRFRSISNEFGPEAILPYSYGGNLGVLNGASMDRRFFHRLGASQLNRTICSAAGEAGILSVLGAKMGTEPEQFRHSKYIIAWGANIHGNNVHLWPFIEEARRAGAKLVVIDPYRTRTARLADWHIQINPGTDVALALGMMHVIIAENLYDSDYVSRHTTGFDDLKQRVLDYPPGKVADWTGIPAEDIIRLAREYATSRPAVIRLNYGIQRAQNGGMAVRTVTMLPCITGSWKEIGGGLQLSLSGAFPTNKAALTRTDLMQGSPLGSPARTINMVELGKALNEVTDPPVKALFVYNSNPAAVCPDRNNVVRGLSRPDLFTVVHEQFLTDTCDYADIVLPATTFFEHKDLVSAYGHYYYQLSNQAIAPLGESRSNVDLFTALAARMGFEDPCFRESPDDMIDLALSSEHPWLQGITRARLETDNHLRLNFPTAVAAAATSSSTANSSTSSLATPNSPATTAYLPFADGNFPTASGKAELYSTAVAALGLDPVSAFVPPIESRHQQSPFPLELLARKADNFLNSTFCNVRSVAALERPDLLELSSNDATARGISDGDRVRIFNDRGELHLVASINTAIRPGVVAARLNWARLSSDSNNINVLTSDRLTDLGAGATFYSALVQVERATAQLSR